MLIINNEQEFLKVIGETIHTWFGNGRAAEEGKEAILKTILTLGAPVITGKLEKIEEQPQVKPKKKKDE